jgi:hypothetical protein
MGRRNTMKPEVEKTLVCCTLKEKIANIINDLNYLASEGNNKNKYYEALWSAQALDLLIDNIRYSF